MRDESSSRALRRHASFECTGFDQTDDMLRVAQNRLPKVDFHQGDMTDFDLGKTFDTVACLYAAIAHVNTEDNLNKAVASMARHVRPGGMLIVEPFLQPERVRANAWSNKASSADGTQLVEVGRSWIDNGVLAYEAKYLIGTSEGIEQREIFMTLGFFSWDQLKNAFAKAGLENIVVDRVGIWENKGLIMGSQPK